MNYLKYLLSTRVSLVLLILFAVAMAAATFIENDHGTAVARSQVYEAWWFEMIMVWLAVNFLAHIGQYKLFHRSRWPIGLFHLAFVIIILGAGITRYFGHEGIIHIREGSTESTYYSAERFLQLKQAHSGKRFEKPLSLISHNFKPQTTEVSLGEPTFKVTVQEYIPNAKEEITTGNKTYFDFAVAIGEGRQDYMIEEGNALAMGNLLVGTTASATAPVKIFRKDSSWVIQSKVHLQVMEMATQQIGALHAGSESPLQMRSLYQWDSGAFMLKAIHEKAALTYTPEKDKKEAKNFPDYVRLKITDAEDKPVTESFIKIVSFDPGWHSFVYGNQSYAVTYGPKAEKLPFQLQLRKFELERYPGSQSPASYASELQVIDGSENFPYRVFMNNVLDHKGYRFYQSSFDNDEKGTILSVNQDRPGTYLTYLGYFLLSLGMLLTLFARGSRFRLLNKRLGSIHKKAPATATLSLLLLSFAAQAETPSSPMVVPEEKAAAYGRLVVQDLDGRMKPLNTLANEIVRKLNGRSTILIPSPKGDLKLTSEQFLLAVQMDPETFSQLPIIKIDEKKSKRAFEALGIEPTNRISFQQFLNKEG
ncbi:MAG: cytochrome C biogenesis protein, partial [Chitinophagaceae bacterium]